MTHRPVTVRLLAALAVLVLIAAACDSGGDDDATATPDARTEADENAEETLEGEEADVPEKPEVEIPEGDPPAELQTTDLVEGDGAEAAAGSTVEVHYVGVLFSDGTEFDASYDRGQPFAFSLGAGQVIQGWDQGVEGMKVGGRRHLVIPPELGYGDRGAGGVIPPGATLVFVVDLLSVS